MPRIASFLPLTALVALLAACGGSDSPTDPGANDNDDNGPGEQTRVIKEDPSFAQDIHEIFTRKGCTAGSCHGGGAGGLTLTSASTSYDNLVGVASEGTGDILVVAGDAAASYLVDKLEASPSFGARMPLGGTPLDNIDLQNIKNWINQGAKNN